jgi:thymidylate kinase
MAKMQIVYLVGIDGSGKTTLAKSLVSALNQSGTHARYFYGQHQPLFFRVLRWMARKTALRSVDPNRNYQVFTQTKTGAGKKFGLLTRIYAIAWLADYWIGAMARLTAVCINSPGVVVIDRYYLDQVVNISQLMGLDDTRLSGFAIATARFFFHPSMTIFVDVTEAVAFARKNDVPSIDYLTERRARYQMLARLFSMRILNGDCPADEVLKESLKAVQGLRS